MDPYLILSLIPFILFFCLLLFTRTSILKSSLVTYLLFLLFTFFIWRIETPFLIVSLIKGFLTSIDILLIIFGALFFLDLLRHRQIISYLIHYLQSVSKDYRIQTIFLAWFLENFIEGVAGFGTPSTIVAPILVALGISPISAVVLALFGNSVSVVFGAAGTPIRVGFSTLDYSGVPILTAVYNMVGLLVPSFMAWFLVRTLKKPIKEFWQILPFSLWSGFLFTICSYLTVFLGQEFPSIIGSLLSFLIILLTTRMGFLVPTHPISFNKTPALPFKKPLLVLSPYLMLIVFLIIGKFTLGSMTLSLFSGQSHSINFFNPGLIFLLVSFIYSLFWKLNFSFLKPTAIASIRQSIPPFAVILLMSSMVQLLTLSGYNFSGLPSIIETLSLPFKYVNLILLAPFVGAFGSLITGSATISNLMFGGILNQSALASGLSAAKILSLQTVGAGFGNMFALADVITAEAVVGLKGEESRLIKIIAPYCLILLTILVLIALFVF